MVFGLLLDMHGRVGVVIRWGKGWELSFLRHQRWQRLIVVETNATYPQEQNSCGKEYILWFRAVSAISLLLCHNISSASGWARYHLAGALRINVEMWWDRRRCVALSSKWLSWTSNKWTCGFSLLDQLVLLKRLTAFIHPPLSIYTYGLLCTSQSLGRFQ